MKVLVSAYACDPSRGGEFINGWSYAYNAKNGISIWCITTPEGKESIMRFLQQHPLPTLRMIYVEIPSWLQRLKETYTNYGVYLHYWFFQHRAFTIAQQLNKKENFDVVHHATYSSLQLGSFLWRLDKPMLFGPVGGGQHAPKKFKSYFGKWWSLERQRDLMSYVLLHTIRTPVKMLKKAGITLVVNQETFALAERYGARKIIFAPCTLLPDDFGPDVIPVRNNGGTMRLLWVGRLLARKGLRIVLEALANVDVSINVTLTIIGDGVQSRELPLWLNELGLTNRVTCEGQQPLSRVREAYAQHDVFIYCSLRETLASQLCESMSFGLPLITFNMHGARIFVPEDAAWKIKVADPHDTIDDIRKAIEYLFHHPEKRKELGERAFFAAKQFSWSNRIKVINTYYDTLVDGTPTHLL